MNQTYKALTRTYRPQTFEDIVSQDHVSNTLKNAIKQNRLSHAYMFCGPRGVGKTTMARVLARVVNGVDSTVDGEALNQTLNIVELDAASNRRIDDVRSLKEVIRVPPQNGRYKIFIIDEVHMLTKEAFNALLKTLEEPPPHIIFIFATTEPHKVLPTILSRVQRFDFKRISVAEIVDRLRKIAQKEKIKVDDESLHVIAKRADGALRDALGLMDQVIAFCGDTISYKDTLRALNVVDIDHLFAFMDAVRKREAHTGLLLIDQLLQSGTDIQEFLVSLTEHIRNLYISRSESGRKPTGSDSTPSLVEVTAETRKKYNEQSALIPEDDLMRMLFLVSESQFRIKEAQQPRVHLEVLLLKLVHMHHSVDLNRLIDGIEDLKKKLKESGNAEETGTLKSESNSKRPEEQLKATGQAEPTANTGSQDPGVKTEQVEAAESNQHPSFAKTDKSVKPAAPNVDTYHPQDDDTEPDVFGRPALGGAGTETLKSETPIAADTETPATVTKAESIADVRSRWSQFLQNLQTEAPRMLYFQVQRARVVDLKGLELHLSVDNAFAHQLVTEHKILLGRLLKKQMGTSLQVKCRVEKNSKRDPEALSPYERFKELQQNDPNLRSIVELFGAELEY